MPGVGSDIASSFGLKKGGKKPLIQEVTDDPEPEDAAPSPKQKLTQTLGAEARELLTGGSAAAEQAPKPASSKMLISEVSAPEPEPEPKAKSRVVIEEVGDDDLGAPPEDSAEPAVRADFIPAEGFAGAKEGYVYKLGGQGTGYYQDGSAACAAPSAHAKAKVPDRYAATFSGEAKKERAGATSAEKAGRASLDEISMMAKSEHERAKRGQKPKKVVKEVLSYDVSREGSKIKVSVAMPGRSSSKGVMLAVSGTDLYSDLTLRAELYEQLRIPLPAVVDQEQVKAKFSKRTSRLNIALTVVGEGNRAVADSLQAKQARKAKLKKRAAGVTKKSEAAAEEKRKTKIEDLKICQQCGGLGQYTDKQDIMSGLTGQKYAGIQRVITTECPACNGEGYVDQKKLREQRRKANGGKDPEPEEEEEGGLDAMGRLNAADAAKYADYKAAMDPEKRKEFEAKLADARAGITRES